MSETLHAYLWIAIAGGIFGFAYNFGIGANDVANAFATSVASKSVTLPQAVAIASIFEFCGAVFLGASVSSTVRGKIFNTADYEEMPEVVMLGMFTSLVSASLMMMIATYWGMPVSTTHTVIGCIIGFAVSGLSYSCTVHIHALIMFMLLHHLDSSFLPWIDQLTQYSFLCLPFALSSSVSCKWYTISQLG